MGKAKRDLPMEIVTKENIRTTDLMVLEHTLGNKIRQLMKEVLKMD
jgi:hypothetical protein